MHILHISFKKSNRNNLFNYILKTKNIHVTEYDFFDPHDYEALENDNYKYDGLILGSKGGGRQISAFNIDKLESPESINLYAMIPEKKLRLFKLIQKYANIPILGICYGAQLLNIFYGGSTSTIRATKKTGYESIQIDTNNPLFTGLPSDIQGEFNTWYPNNQSFLSNIIAVTKEDNMMAAQSFFNKHYALYFHIVHGDTILQKIVDNFINIVEREKNHITILKVFTVGLFVSLYVLFM
jgi:GMP synthase-like glutamine amidotransferase